MNIYNIYTTAGAHIDQAYINPSPTDKDDSLFQALILEKGTIEALREAFYRPGCQIVSWDELICAAAHALDQRNSAYDVQTRYIARQEKAATEALEAQNKKKEKDAGYLV